jgi:hypothetical protein
VGVLCGACSASRQSSSSRFPALSFLNFIFIFCSWGVVCGRGDWITAFNAGERDATRLHHCNHVSRCHDGSSSNRAGPTRIGTEQSAGAERSNRQQPTCCRVRSSRGPDVYLVIAIRLVAYSVGIVDDTLFRDQRRHGSDRIRLELSIAPAATGRNTGYIDAGGEHDSGSARCLVDHLSATGSHHGWRVGQFDRDRRPVDWWMLRSCGGEK